MATKAFAALLAAVLGIGSIAPITAAARTPEGQGGLSWYYHQRVTWKSCNHEKLDAAGAECADITVPLDYSAPRGRTITVAISRLEATGTDRHGIVLTNPGGPGGPGLDMPLTIAPSLAADVRARFDLIGVDPRGIGRSNPVDCRWPTGPGLSSAGLDRADFDRHVATQSRLARLCAEHAGDLLPHISTRNTARDLDVVRGALGEERTSYFGWSYGTYLGAVYAQMFPRRVDRLVLDSAIDPAEYPLRMFQGMARPNEEALDDWADWAAARDAELHFGTTRAQVRALVEGLVRQASREPFRLGRYRVDHLLLQVLYFTPLMDSRLDADFASWVRAFQDAAEGRATPVPASLEEILAVVFPQRPTPGDAGQLAVICGDGAFPRDPEWYWEQLQRHRAVAPVAGPVAYAPPACMSWPTRPGEPPTRVRNNVPTLIIQATGDTRTPYESGVALHRRLPKSRLVTLADVRIHAVFGRLPNRCVDDIVNSYFRAGALPAADRTCRSD
ncbi:alpha/beta hydrolase [Actinosynnema sp. NPDC050436]|uniref:alpha/beta hydrolase n=1 Tax=Actinosynnema sp. NPDC050436 TaxID=3155659 RepID=UPI0033E38A8A